MRRTWRLINLLLTMVLLAGVLPPARHPALAAAPSVAIAEPGETIISPSPTSTLLDAPPFQLFLPLLEQTIQLDQTTATLFPGRGGSLRLRNGITAAFTPAAVREPMSVSLARLLTPTVTTPGLGVGGPAFNLELRAVADRRLISRLPHLVTPLPAQPFVPATVLVTPSIVLEIPYIPAEIWGLDERTLGLYTRHSPDAPWQRVPSAVYPERDLIVAHVEQGGEYVPLGELAVVQLDQSDLRLALDPDDNIGYANWPDVGRVEELTYNLQLAEAVKQRFEDADCTVDILITRDATPNVSTSLRADRISGFGADVAVTLAFNALYGFPWGGPGDGGPVAFARGGTDVDLAQRLLTGMLDYTARRSTRSILVPPPHPAFNSLTATYAHLETLYLDHTFDWPIINTGFDQIADGVYAGLALELGERGALCNPPGGGGGPWPPPLPPRPSAEQIRRWRDLGWQNYQRYGMDPVSFSTGNHILQLALAHIPGRGGLDIDLTLTYNAQDQRGDLLGYGWSFPYNIRLQRYADESVGIVFADGRTLHYEWDGSGYIPPPGAYDRLERGEEFWQLTSRDGEQTWLFQETITGLGVLKEWRDQRGNALTFTHDLSDQEAWRDDEDVPRPPLTTISDATGRSVIVIPDDQGRISAFVLPDNRRFDFTYDERGDLVSVTDANTPVRGVHSYEYDERHRIVRQRDPEGILFLTNIYDDRDRVIEQHDADGVRSFAGYNPIDRTTTFTDNLGLVWVYTYDELNRVVAERDPLGQTVKTVYDPNYNITERRDARGNPTGFTYDARGNLTSRRDPLPTPTDACRSVAYDEDITRWEYSGGGASANLPTAMIDALGNRWEYHYDGEGNLEQVIAPIGTTTARYDEWGQLTHFTDANNHTTQYFYDPHGNLERTIDPLNGVSSSTYDITGRELSFTDANDHTVAFTYSGNDQITGITDPRGKVTTFRYDRNDLLTATTDRAGVTRRFTYDDNLKLTGELDHPNGAWENHQYDQLYRRIASTDRNGHTTQYRYDDAGRLFELEDPTGAITRYGYDADGNLTRIDDALGGVTLMRYDAAGRLAETSDPAGSAVSACYDAEDRLVRQIGPRFGEVTGFAYDAMGRLVQITNALGAVTQFFYDPAGNRTAEIDPLGNRSDLEYDPLDRIITLARPTLPDGSRPTTRFGYDPVGNTTVITSPRGFVTLMAYDNNDNLERITDPLGAETNYSYDPEDRPLTIRDPNGHVTRMVYDPVGNLIAITNGAGETSRLAYDPAYNLVEQSDPLGRRTRYDYDPRNDLLRATDPLGHTTAYERDALGRVSAQIDAAGRRTGYSYDPVGRLLAVIDPLLGHTQYDYSVGGDLSAISDANGNTTRFTHDALSQLTGEVNPLGKRWRYAYDAAGRLAERVDALGRTSFYEYDSNGRLAGVRYSVGPAIQAPVSIDYDLDGNELRRCNGLGCISHNYDALGRPVSTTDWAGRMVGRSYDGTGNLVELLYPGGQPVRYEHDEANRLAAVTIPGNRTSVIERDGAGRLRQIAHPNGTLSSYSFDEAGRLTAIDHRQRGVGAPQTAFAYALDRVGNRTALSETRAALDGGPRQVNLTRGYGYDALDRLTEATSNRGSATDYHFDAAGNRLAQTGTALAPDPGLPELPVKPAPIQEQYTYNDANQLVMAGDASLSYNANGERVREERPQPGGGAIVEYRFDLEGRPVEITARLNGVVQLEARYEYDGYGRRARKTVRYPQSGLPAQVTTFLYDGLEIIGARVEQGGNVRESRYYLMPSPITGMRRPFAMERLETGAALWLQADGLDSIVALTDEDGDLAGHLIYGEYGRHLAGDPALQPFTYTAQDYDAETGLIHFHARLYDPARGVWLSQDPYRGVLNNLRDRNRYSYVDAKPVSLVDIYGYKGCGFNLTCQFFRADIKFIAIPYFLLAGDYLSAAYLDNYIGDGVDPVYVPLAYLLSDQSTLKGRERLIDKMVEVVQGLITQVLGATLNYRSKSGATHTSVEPTGDLATSLGKYELIADYFAEAFYTADTNSVFSYVSLSVEFYIGTAFPDGSIKRGNVYDFHFDAKFSGILGSVKKILNDEAAWLGENGFATEFTMHGSWLEYYAEFVYLRWKVSDPEPAIEYANDKKVNNPINSYRIK